MNSTMTATASEPAKSNTTDMSRGPSMVFVDDEGLEEQFLTEDEVSQEVMDVTVNQVMTPVENDAAPLNPIYTEITMR